MIEVTRWRPQRQGKVLSRKSRSRCRGGSWAKKKRRARSVHKARGGSEPEYGEPSGGKNGARKPHGRLGKKQSERLAAAPRPSGRRNFRKKISYGGLEKHRVSL